MCYLNNLLLLVVRLPNSRLGKRRSKQQRVATIFFHLPCYDQVPVAAGLAIPHAIHSVVEIHNNCCFDCQILKKMSDFENILSDFEKKCQILKYFCQITTLSALENGNIVICCLTWSILKIFLGEIISVFFGNDLNP